MLSATQFNEIADALFERIVERIDATDAADDIELNQGVLEITCAHVNHANRGNSKIIINRHAPTQEIWVAAKSGGYHFKWADGTWIDTRSGEPLADAINRVVFEQSGVNVAFV
jgi:CyaY protein